MSDAVPAASAISIYRVTSANTPFLTRHQVVQLDTTDWLVTLVNGAMNGPSGLTSCILAPASFRIFVVLLLTAPEVASYASLYAAFSCPDEPLEALLSCGSLNDTGFQTLVQSARALLEPLREKELKRQLIPLRHALGRLNQTLAQKQFGWAAVSKYGGGYMLTRRTPS